jgi:hypothetical protein
MTVEAFTFGIPLIARAAAADWARVESLLGLTLASVAAQNDRDFEVILCGHDRPDVLDAHPGVTFLRADWPVEAVRADNCDAGRKKHAINAGVLAGGGGFLMFLDADDWVDIRTVATARAVIEPHQVGGLIAQGFALDLQTLRALEIPHPEVFDRGFHGVCGSTTIARLRPGDPDPLRRDPHTVLHEHYRWPEVAREHDVALAQLPLSGCYVVNTRANHSEIQGPFASWRAEFNAAVTRHGDDVDDAFAARFGLSLDRIRAVSRGRVA